MPRTTREHARLAEARQRHVPWKKWGPYLSERQWGTVRENLDRGRDAWHDLTHDQARSRAYLSGEDGLGGFCDDRMVLCFSVALWNGRDRVLKERLFGLTNPEGNHGEDVKEYYFYLDSTPTHSYCRMLYKYPQAAFPYAHLVDENRQRSRVAMEYELLDTGVFDHDRYWDVFVEYAKAAPEDILIRITAINRGPEPAPLHLLPQLWFRNTWWAHPEEDRPSLRRDRDHRQDAIAARHGTLGTRHLYCDEPDELLFTENETNHLRLYGRPNDFPYVKDAFHDYVVEGHRDAVNPRGEGTKAAFHRFRSVGPGESTTVRLRLSPQALGTPFDGTFDRTFELRQRECGEFYEAIIPATVGEDDRRMIRQGYAGLLWSKQAYVYDVQSWLRLQGITPEGSGDGIRNRHWFHLYSSDVISMPDKWEYPWFAAWDLAFQAVPLAVVDPDFAREQMDLMLLDRYQHPTGQLPAYEWNFEDVNPPVHAWATLFNYRYNREALGSDGLPFLRRVFHKLMLNFNWWSNLKDPDGNGIFEGGFLGLDGIGVFDRKAALPTGGTLEQTDGTAWMALYAQNMLEMALELALVDPTYEDLAIKFYGHFVRIAAATRRIHDRDALWDEEDGFFYDVLEVPGHWSSRIKVRSMMGLLPLCAVTVFRPEVATRLRRFSERVQWFSDNQPELVAAVQQPHRPGVGGRFMLSLLDEDKLRRVLARMLDPEEFLSDYGLRSLSRHHLEHPYVFFVGKDEYRVAYQPAESDSGMFSGNTNWRGPIWAPVNALVIRALLQMYTYYGDDFRVECPTRSRRYLTLFGVAQELTNRLAAIFRRDPRGHRPVFGGAARFQRDPHWRDHLLFYEHFHGDDGAGLGASHMTGWTALIPALVQIFAGLRPEQLLAAEHPLPRAAEWPAPIAASP